VDELGSDRSEETRCFSTVTLALLKEEAGAEYSSLGQFVSHGARNRRLAGARHALQPEYAIVVRIIGPFLYLAEKGDPGVGMAFGVVLVGEMVKRGAFGGAQLSENDFAVDVED
jgi:hypothetical protein